MVSEGEAAPSFELPAVADGEQERIALDEQIEDAIVVLIFYPGDFLTNEETGQPFLTELDLFTMQTGLTVLGISGDSVFSHRGFASKHSLSMPLLSDVDGEVATSYGVAVEDTSRGYQANRAVFVLDQTGTVTHRWVGSSIEEYPQPSAIREAVRAVSDEETAMDSYDDGFTAHERGYERLEAAMARASEREWVAAEEIFLEAEEAFDTAMTAFDTATRFAADDIVRSYTDVAGERVEALSRAAEWFAEAAEAFAAGEGRVGESVQKDANEQLSEAESLPDPLEPAAFPPDEPLDRSNEETEPLLSESSSVEPDSGGADGLETGASSATIDEDELEEITAELEAQTDEAADGQNDRASGASEGWQAVVTNSQSESSSDDDSIDLDLDEPTGSNSTDPKTETDGPEDSRG